VAAVFILRSPPLARAEAETIEHMLSEAGEPEAGAVSLVETDQCRDLWQVEAYYGEAPSPALLARLGLNPAELTIEPLPETDWVARSLEGLAPVFAGRFIVHGSHHRDRLPPGGIVVEITAGTAFGTGHHATTRGCLLAADCLLKRRPPRSILDLGCGTGILAIAAAKAARAPTLALDTDAEAVRVTRQNARLNGASTFVRAALAMPAMGGIGAATRRFDLIFANILAGPLISLAPELAPRLEPGGALILSGLMVDQERQTAAAYRNRGLRLARRLRLADWSILVFTRPSSRQQKGPAGGFLPGPHRRSAAMPITGRRPTPSGGSRCA
jgi:ribosomal protein L11 methyltransferase